jgi:UDP-N-acetyl-D-mannosaminuronate dehydrogenase
VRVGGVGKVSMMGSSVYAREHLICIGTDKSTHRVDKACMHEESVGDVDSAGVVLMAWEGLSFTAERNNDATHLHARQLLKLVE